MSSITRHTTNQTVDQKRKNIDSSPDTDTTTTTKLVFAPTIGTKHPMGNI